MERTSIEVWQRIFAFSCVDGGRTGCSLSLVSKAFHDVSRRYRYYSVTLKGLTAALKFAQILEKHPPQDMRSQGDFSINSATSSYTAVGICGAQVVGITSPAMEKSEVREGHLNSVADAIPISIHHLHVTDQFPYAYPEPSPSKMKAQDILTFTRKIAQKIYKRNTSPPKDIVQTALARDPSQSIESLMHVVLYTILLGAAPTLETLSISVAFNTHAPVIPPLPVLTELTLNYSFESHVHCMCCVMRTLQAPLPALRMLDLLGTRCHTNPEEILYHAAIVAGQNLTHICLPVIRASNILDMRLEEDHALWEKGDNAGLAVYMQSDPWHDRTETALPYDEWTRRLQALDRKAGPGRGRVVLTSRETSVGKCYAEQEENWLERVIGGRGRWIQRQSTPAECNSTTADDEHESWVYREGGINGNFEDI
ncbi:hypothetical protein FIBSPDRAFT_855461 [Athelia psychrophila]|uniref:Uncharacterized protein n=1 Tax=Athelia psychrophila TaxID=1759441 RepID=A0A166P892_9AGAM|nr:hypothetical protein FIBSPDRAFT_855461 [Fibularhizoctonia sp. CBS 109695]